MRLLQVAQRAADLDRAVAFYGETLGLALIARFDPPGLAFFDLGSSRLLIEVGAPSALLYIEVDDLDARFESMATAGVDIVAEPRLIHRDEDGRFGPAGGEEWMGFLHDSEENLLALMERRSSG